MSAAKLLMVGLCRCRRNQFLRDPHEETQGGKYPMPDHHPECDAFVQEEFGRIELEGDWCICEMRDIDAMTEGEHGCTVTTVKLTRDQFENLPEFGGF